MLFSSALVTAWVYAMVSVRFVSAFASVCVMAYKLLLAYKSQSGLPYALACWMVWVSLTVCR